MSKEIMMFLYGEGAPISHFIGKTLVSAVTNDDKDEVLFTFNDGEKWKMHHIQDCCEGVWLEDVNGSFDSLIGEPIITASERSNQENGGNHGGTQTWTFYELTNHKGTVTMRWCGESNGYYSEEVSITKV